MSERRVNSLILLLAGDVARMIDPPVSTESIRRWTLAGKLRSVAQLSDGTRLFMPSDVAYFIEMRKKLKLTDPVLIIEDVEAQQVLKAHDGE